jgi:uracil phosphoribosyltransferase
MSEAPAASKKNNDMFGPNIHISSHPVLFHKISVLRSATTPPGVFRSVLREVTYHLGYEATKELNTKNVPLTVSYGKEKAEEHLDCTGYKIADRVSLIPILRSGLGMSEGMLELLPKAAVHHIGMYRMPGQAPVQYFNRLPRKCESNIAFVLDPVIASNMTVMAVIGILKKVGFLVKRGKKKRKSLSLMWFLSNEDFLRILLLLLMFAWTVESLCVSHNSDCCILSDD